MDKEQNKTKQPEATRITAADVQKKQKKLQMLKLLYMNGFD